MLMQRLIPIFVIGALAGCSSPSVDQPSAMKVMTAAMTTTVSADGQVVKADWTPTNGQVDVTLTNPIGNGTAHVTGSASDVNNVITTAVDITFTHWSDVANDVTLDGALHEKGTFTTASPLAGNVEIDGALAASGSVNATVDFDIKGDYGPSGFDVSGNVGGNVINSSFSVSAH
jgi:hypothetical protein